MLGFYVQLEAVKVGLYLFIVEFYSYFILCYGFVMIVVKHSEAMRVQLKYCRL
jgi:hypothetical protein